MFVTVNVVDKTVTFQSIILEADFHSDHYSYIQSIPLPFPDMSLAPTPAEQMGTELTKSIAARPRDRMEFIANHHGINRFYKLSTTDYQLPDDPYLVMHFFTEMEAFFNILSIDARIRGVSFERNDITQQFVDAKTVRGRGPIAAIYAQFYPEMQEEITVKKLTPTLEKYTEGYLTDKNAFFEIFCTHVMNAYPDNTLIRNIIDLFFLQSRKESYEDSTTRDKKIDLICEIQRFLKQKGRKYEIPLILSLIDKLEKKRLIAPCLGKIADDCGRYNSNYTEITFFMDAIIAQLDNGDMGIVELDRNKSHLAHYQPGKRNDGLSRKRNDGLLRRELEHLGKIIRLNITPDCDVNQTVVFTEEASNRLKARLMGLTKKHLIGLQYARGGQSRTPSLFDTGPSTSGSETLTALEKGKEVSVSCQLSNKG